jgi:hypothetical protein
MTGVQAVFIIFVTTSHCLTLIHHNIQSAIISFQSSLSILINHFKFGLLFVCLALVQALGLSKCKSTISVAISNFQIHQSLTAQVITIIHCILVEIKYLYQEYISSAHRSKSQVQTKSNCMFG